MSAPATNESPRQQCRGLCCSVTFRGAYTNNFRENKFAQIFFLGNLWGVEQQQTHTVMKEQVIAELSKLGMHTKAGSLGDLLADRMVSKVKAIRFFRAEGCERLAEEELTNTTFGPAVLNIVKNLV